MDSSFEKKFCGAEFWSTNQTWNSDNPDFTECFHKTILAWIPSLVLVLFSINEFRLFKPGRKNPLIAWNVYNLTKILLTGLLIVLAIVGIAFTGITDGDDNVVTDVYPVDYFTNILYLFTYIWSLILLISSLKNGFRTSQAQFFFYATGLFCGAFTLRSMVQRIDKDEYDQDESNRLLYFCAIQYGLYVIMFFLNCFADAEPKQYVADRNKYKKTTIEGENPCPMRKSSYLSQLLYFWAEPFVWQGYKNPLTLSDLWDLDSNLTSNELVPKFDDALNPLIEKAKSSKLSITSRSTRRSKDDLANSIEKDLKKGFSVFPALARTFGVSFFVGALMQIMVAGLQLLSPQIMKLLMNFVQTSTDDDFNNDPETWHGYVFASLLLVVTMVSTFLNAKYTERMALLGIQMQTTLVSTIYRKSLKLSGAARKESSTGEIVNLMSVDVTKITTLMAWVNFVWSSPIQIALSIYLIYAELGWAIFVGFAIMICAFPLFALGAVFMKRYQQEQFKNKDQRVKMINEILGGIKVLKLYGWEPSFVKQVMNFRDEEIKVLKKNALIFAAFAALFTIVPTLVLISSFATFVLSGNELSGIKAFVTLNYLNILRMPLGILPTAVTWIVQAMVSLRRIDKFLNNDELDQGMIEHETSDNRAIVVENGAFSWGNEEPMALEDVGVEIEKGSLTAIVGAVGCGKTSLVSAILGEMEKKSGRVNIVGSIAYVPQQAWMQNASVKDNVLFGKKIDDNFYDNVIEACALRSDLKILPAGDSTEIGEKGINLSGGQKQRVSLARAVYSDAEIYLLDDPLSAVDPHVGKHIFDHVIGNDGMLSNKTRVLVTHGVTYLPKTNHIIVVKEGKISEQGSYEDLLRQKGEFANFLLEYMKEIGGELADDQILKDIQAGLEETLGKNELARQISERQDSLKSEDVIDLVKEASKPKMITQKSRSVSIGDKVTEESNNAKQEDIKAGATLIEEENVETGNVNLKIYKYYAEKYGIFSACLTLFGMILYQGSNIGTSYWLSIWTENSLNGTCYKDDDPNCTDFYLGIYGVFGVGQMIGTLLLSLTILLSALNASRSMHNAMLDCIVRGPMSFFDTTPIGRVVNRFTKDVDICDNALGSTLRGWTSMIANFIGSIILIISVFPYFTFVILPMILLFYFIQKVYVSTARQLKRLVSVSTSPIYSHFGETLNGVSTIRAFGLQSKFTLHSEKLVDTNISCTYPSIIAQVWLQVRLEVLGNLIIFAAALFSILFKESSAVNSSTVGLIITYATTMTQVLAYMVKQQSDLETNIVAVERIKEYIEVESEADWKSYNAAPPDTWPNLGSLEFKNYGMRYRKGLDLVLKAINAKIQGGEKIGIVGRTGAGKSSLTVALFRLVEPANGTIVIDDLDISNMGLHELRTKLTIIPQDPVLFSGTLRINLDPFSHYSDDELWKALELAHLKDYASNLETGLLHEIAEGGENLSVGQRQLVCLARALLRKTKILILDEATAAVDLETDDLIQATIRKEFKDCTVLTIAHRLNTIMDYDRIMVLDKGIIAEFDSPSRLLEASDSIFHSMAKDAGLV